MSAALLLVFACSAREQTPPRNAVADLEGTSWQLVKFQGSDDKTLTPNDKKKYTIAFGTDGRVSARIDCNRGMGTWKSSGPNQLEFGRLALTRAMCPPGSLHDLIVKHWEFVRSYIIKDGHLFLSLMADGGIFEFEPIGGSKPASTKSPVAFKGPVKYVCTQAGVGKRHAERDVLRDQPAMVFVEPGHQTRPEFQVPAASGAKYEGQELMFWNACGEAPEEMVGRRTQVQSRVGKRSVLIGRIPRYIKTDGSNDAVTGINQTAQDLVAVGCRAARTTSTTTLTGRQNPADEGVSNGALMVFLSNSKTTNFKLRRSGFTIYRTVFSFQDAIQLEPGF